jgi:dCTP deaminase
MAEHEHHQARFPRLAEVGDQNHPKTGIFPSQSIANMLRSREIEALPEIETDQIQPASLDLRLGDHAYRVRASFLPGSEATVIEKIEQMDGLPPLTLNGQGTVLEKGCVYVIPLLENANLPISVKGIANPKSSIGRLDVLTRLITDRGVSFDQVPPGYKGPLYVEVAPQTFSIVVRKGSRLNQLRFQRGNPRVSSTDLISRYDAGQLIQSATKLPIQNEQLVPVTVNLKGIGPHRVVGYRAKKHTDKIDVDASARYDPHNFWDQIIHHGEEVLILDPEEFYILATCEEVGVPPDLAAEMVPYFPSSGEYRVHYAGFFDPGFGWDGKAGGSRAVLEVRSYIPFSLEHAQPVGWLRYMRMAGAPDKTYGAKIRSHYQNQGLTLAKQFRPFSDESA